MSWAAGDAKALLDWASLSTDEEFGLGLAAFFRTSARPENAVRVRYPFDNGLQAKADVELDLSQVESNHRPQHYQETVTRIMTSHDARIYLLSYGSCRS
jgi:hypothetical protein